MIGFAVRRLLGLLPTMLVIVIVSFAVIRLSPGSPFSSERAVSAELLARLDARYGFELPFHEQLLRYIGNLVRGDLGLSTKYPDRTVNDIIAAGLPNSLSLGLLSLGWALLVGVTAGIIGALRQNTVWDHAAMMAAMVGISVPTFVMGPLLALSFGLSLYWLPPAGWGAPRHMVLPALTLGTVYAAYVARLMRAGMLEVVRADFVRTARAKGLPNRLVLWRHMLRGGLLPLVTFLGPAAADIFVGSVVVEKVFAIPGLGTHFVDAAFNRDYFLVMGIVVVYSALLLVMNALVDIAYGLLDPRVRLR